MTDKITENTAHTGHPHRPAQGRPEHAQAGTDTTATVIQFPVTARRKPDFHPQQTDPDGPSAA